MFELWGKLANKLRLGGILLVDDHPQIAQQMYIYPSRYVYNFRLTPFYTVLSSPSFPQQKTHLLSPLTDFLSTLSTPPISTTANKII